MLTFEESEWKVYENSLYYASTLCISRTWDENHNPGWHLFSPERPWAEDPGVPCLDFRLTHGKCEIINCVSVCVFNSINRRFPRWLSGRESICQCQRHRRSGFDPWVGKIPWRSEWQPTPVFLLGESYGQRSLVGYSTWGLIELDTNEATEQSRMQVLY